LKLNELVALAVKKFNAKESYTEATGRTFAYSCLHAAEDAVREAADDAKTASALCAEANGRRAVDVRELDLFSATKAKSVVEYLHILLERIVENLMLQDSSIASREKERDANYH